MELKKHLVVEREKNKKNLPDISKALSREPVVVVNEEEDEEEVSTRRILLKYKSCCGCGCSTELYYRDVPEDSHLQDGDYMKGEPLDTDDYYRRAD